MSDLRAKLNRQRMNTSNKTVWRQDLQAGLTVAIFAIPQAMAYAVLAGVAPIYGLYTAVVMSIIAALLGSSPYVNTGPTNSAALLTAAALAPFAAQPSILPYVVTLCLMVGGIRLVLGLLKCGTFLAFVPESSFLGFTVGAGLLIALGQLHHLFGVAAPAASWFPARMVETLQSLPDAQPLAIAIGVGTVALALGLEKQSKKWPVAMLIMLVAGLIAYAVRDPFELRTVGDIASIPTGLPPLSWPIWDAAAWTSLLPAAAAIAVIGLIEAASIGQTLALRNRQHLDVDREFIGQGVSQIAASFCSGIPGSGSFSRSLLIESSGGKTRWANIYFGIFTALALLTIPQLLEWIPIAALSGLLVYIGVRLIDVARIHRVIQTSRADTTILVLTFLITVFYRIEFGIFAGMLGAALVHLYRTRTLHIVEYVPDAQGTIKEIPYAPGTLHESSDVVVLGLSGDLYYGVAMLLRNQLERIIREQKPTHLIIRIRRAFSIDYSCWSALFDVAEGFHRQGGSIYLSGIRREHEAIIQQARMSNILPSANMFPATESPFEAFGQCVNHVFTLAPAAASAHQHWQKVQRPTN